jgi:hypothetical protein
VEWVGRRRLKVRGSKIVGMGVEALAQYLMFLFLILRYLRTFCSGGFGYFGFRA